MTELSAGDHMQTALSQLRDAMTAAGQGQVADTRDALVHARASITRALLLTQVPDEPDAA